MLWTLLVLTVVMLGTGHTKGGPTFTIVGQNQIRVKERDIFYVLASYKYCPGSVSCPSCPRQVYVNVFNRSKCLGTMQTIKTDCQYHSCRKKQFRAPPLAGTYGIKMYEVLGNGSCGFYRDTSGQGTVVGTVIVGTPPREPATVTVTSVGFFSATIQWTQPTYEGSSQIRFYTVLIQDRLGNVRHLAEKTIKRRVVATKLTPGTEYNVSVKASNAAGDGGWRVYNFSTRRASLSLVEGPKNKKVALGQAFTLRCLVSGQPRPSITWHKDGEPIVHQHERIFRVLRASAADQGEYMCTASNGVLERNISAKAKVLVVAPPVIQHLYSLSSHDTISGRVGQAILLLCGLTKNTNHVNYAWFKDGRLLTNTSNRTNEHVISIKSADDFGVYECEVFNKAGKTRRRVEIFAEEGLESGSSASSRKRGVAYFYYIVGILGCVSLLLFVIIVAQRHFYRRKLRKDDIAEKPYLTPRDEPTPVSPLARTRPHLEKRRVTEMSELSEDFSAVEYPRPLPSIPVELSEVDPEDPRYADLNSIEKHNYQQLGAHERVERRSEVEEEGQETCDSTLQSAFENVVQLETDEKPYLEVFA